MELWAPQRGVVRVTLRLCSNAAHEARTLDGGGDALFEQVKLFARDRFGQRKAQRAACAAGGKAHGGEHVRGLSGAGRAG